MSSFSTLDIDVAPSPYSYVNLNALLFLAKSKEKVNPKEMHAVWQELFIRYFNQGRTFNLYQCLTKEPVYFAYTIALELDDKKTSIPAAHIEAYIRDLLDFIDFVDKKVIQNIEAITFEWQLHELAGLQDMLETIRDAKIKDLVLRQKINLFIDKMNDARKSAHLAIEQAKEDAIKAQTQLPATMEVKAELMVQILKHLEIPISKANKPQWEDMMAHFGLYYYEDQVKIMRHGLKKKWYYSSYGSPALAFALLLEKPCPEIHPWGILKSAMDHNGGEDLINLLSPQKKPAIAMGVIREWLLSANCITDDIVNMLMEEINSYREDSLARKNIPNNIWWDKEEASGQPRLYPWQRRIIEKLRKNRHLITTYYGKPLSEVLSTPFVMKELKKSHSFKWDPKTNRWEYEGYFVDNETNVYRYLRNLFFEARNELVNYYGYYIKNQDIEFPKNINKEEQSLILEYLNFFPGIKIDKDSARVISEMPYKYDSHLSGFFKWKFCTGLSEEDLLLIYKDPTYYETLKNIGSFSDNSGAFHNFRDLIDEYLLEAMKLFNFADKSERQIFFRLDFSNTYTEAIAEKLAQECPYDYKLVAKFFDIKDEEFNRYELFSEFSSLGYDGLISLLSQGVEVGREEKVAGYKDREGNIIPAAVAQARLIVEYFREECKEGLPLTNNSL